MLIFYALFLMFVLHSCWIKFFIGCFRQAFFIWETKMWSLVTLDRWPYYRVKILCEFAWADSVLVLDKWSSYRSGHLNRFDWNALMIFKCIIFHSSTKSLVPPLHKFTIWNLDLFFTLFGKLNSFNITVYLLTCRYFGRIENNLSCRKVGLHFADFS